jgi:hypothetical protein
LRPWAFQALALRNPHLKAALASGLLEAAYAFLTFVDGHDPIDDVFVFDKEKGIPGKTRKEEIKHRPPRRIRRHLPLDGDENFAGVRHFELERGSNEGRVH